MKISYNWLQQYHDLDLSPDKVAEMLTGCGLEVESQESFQSVKGGLKGVFIGEVLTCDKHPNSDHLSITTVDIGAGSEPLKIVCGAANVAKGQKVAVATLGTTLYFQDKELTLQRTKIRGEVSEGMICAEDELGLGTSHAGIMVLEPSAVAGMPASEYFKVEEDVAFTIGLTPNRVDASSHLGVARDLVAVANNFGRAEPVGATRKYIKIPDISTFRADNDNRHIDVIVEDPEACPRYSGITVSGIHVTDSPDWLKNRLISVGFRPINNIVDITNFILMELGQPLHAFDCDRITGNKVVVRKYPKGTKFVTLDQVERELSENDLMICNGAEPMCIAGVFGGIKSGVTNDTTSVFLESAYFEPRHIRKSSRFHGLQTDASFRFERGANIDITVYALQRAAMMIKEIAGGKISSDIVDVYPSPLAPRIVALSYQNLDRLVGKVINRDVVKTILADLGIIILEETPAQGLRLEIPAFKVDVTREADVIEEILRIYGYNNIELHEEIRSSISFTTNPDPEKVRNLVSDYLAANGFNEIMNNSLTRSTYYTGNLDFPVEQSVKMLNPISRDLDVMRQTLLYGALESIVYNQNRKITDLKMFEFGRVYSTGTHKHDPLPGYHEEKHLAIIMTGRSQSENWNAPDKQVDFYDLKGFLEGICNKLSVLRDQWKVQPYKSSQIVDGLEYTHNDKRIFILGSISSQVLKMFDFKQAVFYAEVNWDRLFSLIPEKSLQYRGIPKFPEVRRDLALLVDHDITFMQIEKLAFQTEKKLLKKVGLFDVYEGEKIGSGKKSYALSLILQDDDKTLTDKEIEKVMDKILRAMAANFNAQLR
ncbi:MAG: phenylalanine--tRNA ligase subunit beta [Bacteroidetes bacterium]|nr:phenylalanine--tRNA ligase subunit beta [Bacteroidota bacterium]